MNPSCDSAERLLDSCEQAFVNWNNLSDSDREEINRFIDEYLAQLDVDLINDCEITGCRSVNHLKVIDTLLYHLITSVTTAIERFKKAKINENKYKIIPGWNRHVKDKYKRSREAFFRLDK